MQTKTLALAVAAAVGISWGTYAESTYKGDPTHAHVGFSVKHLVINCWSVAPSEATPLTHPPHHWCNPISLFPSKRKRMAEGGFDDHS